MKKIALLLLIVCLWPTVTPVHAQTAPYVSARVQQIANLIVTSPRARYDTLFTSSFLAEVSPEQLQPIFSRYATSYGAVSRWRYTDSSKLSGGALRLEFAKGYTVDLHIEVSDTGLHLITGLVLGVGVPQAKSLSAVALKLAALPGRKAFLLAKLDGDKITPLAELNSDTTMALGSAFKLYVLGALEAEIRNGGRHWNDVITLDSASRAFPSGIMQSWPVGTPVTLQTAANLMISISDNTATDLLIHTLGRETVEAAARITGNGANQPFFTTQELFKLKSHGGKLADQYLALHGDERRDFLNEVVARYPRDSVAFSGDPVMVDELEWFATPRQIAKQFQWLREQASGEASRVLDVLAINPGLQFDRSKWAYVGYKGGSEPGVLDMSFLLRSKAGDWYVLTAGWTDEHHAVDEDQLAGLLERAAELVP